VGFHDEDPGTLLDLKLSDSHNEQKVGPNAELDKFLQRPVLIQSYSIPFGGFSEQQFNPWYLFMEHPSIKKKIDNYYLFRGKLKLKIVINASPFYYGTYLVSYRPLATYFSPAQIDGNNKAIAYSQRPHIYVYPQNNQGGEMVLPFFWHRDWLDISEADDVIAMGLISFFELSPLRNANGVSTGTINVQIYASLVDYELSGPSVKLALQSGIDEYGDGIISKPASAIARAAGYLEKVPIIGKFATATKLGASAVSSIASLFGFTNPPDITTVETYTPQPFPRMATTDISTGIEKLTLDSKNELSIDSSITGADLGDELNITSLVTRESYLTSFLWTAADITDTLLFNIAISPCMIGATSETQQVAVQGTPMWMVSRLFQYWRGDIEIRLKFIASQYHRGRVRVSWDPNGDIANTTDSTTEVYNKIIDISRCNDITIRIPYMQDTAYCENQIPLDERYSDTTPLAYRPFFENGVLTIRVLNEQTSPIASADIDVLVFVKGTENLEFANPRDPDPFQRLSPFTVQSGEYKYDEEESENTNICLQDSKPSPNINLIYQGETIVSLRQLLRRFAYSRNISFPDIASSQIWSQTKCVFSRRPLAPGYDPNGINGAVGLVSGTSARYVWCKYHPLVWVSQCFVAERGSYNIRANYIGTNELSHFKVSRAYQNSAFNMSRTGYAQNLGSSLGKQNLSRNQCVNSFSDCAGMSYTNTKTNASLSANLPLYSIFKFITTSVFFRLLGVDTDNTKTDATIVDLQTFPRYNNAINTNYNDMNKIDLYYAAGVDYNPLFFLNVPTIYAYNAVPSSSETVP